MPTTPSSHLWSHWKPLPQGQRLHELVRTSPLELMFERVICTRRCGSRTLRAEPIGVGTRRAPPQLLIHCPHCGSRRYIARIRPHDIDGRMANNRDMPWVVRDTLQSALLALIDEMPPEQPMRPTAWDKLGMIGEDE